MDPDAVLSDDERNEVFEKLNAFNQVVYDFVIRYNKYFYRSRVYHDGIALTMLEVHIVTDIAQSPGITSVELARKWDKTPSYLSQLLRKLEEEGLIYRTLNEQNRKYYNLYLTEKGQAVDLHHKEYDIHSILSTNQELLKVFTLDEIITMRRVMEAYGDLINEE